MAGTFYFFQQAYHIFRKLEHYSQYFAYGGYTFISLKLITIFFLTFFFSISNHIYVKDIFINEKLFSDHVEKKKIPYTNTQR